MASDMEKQERLDTSSTIDFNSTFENDPSPARNDPEPQSNAQPVSESTAAADDEPAYIRGWKLYAVLAITCAISFLMLLDTAILATAVPKITSQFHSLGDVGWYGSSYLLASSTLQPLSGKFYTRFSSKWTFLSFLILFELGSLIAGVATSSNMLIVGRAVSGMGGSGVMNGAMTIISASIPLHKRAAYLGVMVSVAGMGIVLGPVLGGALTEYTTWRWCFLINLPVGAVAAVVLVFMPIPDSKSKVPTKWTFKTAIRLLDLIGFVIFAPTAIMFLLALEWGGNNYPWKSPEVIGLFCGSGAGLIIFIIWEQRHGHDAMFPSSVLKKRIVYSACITQFFSSGCLMVCAYYLAMYFQAVRGVSPLMSGVYTLPQVITQLIAAVISGGAVSKLGYYLPWMILSSICITLSSGLMSTFTLTTSTGIWAGYQIIAGLGRGCGMQMPTVAVQNSVSQAEMPVGNTLLMVAQQFGGAIFISVGQTAFSSGLSSTLKSNLPDMSAKEIIALGATGYRSAFSADVIKEIAKSYNFGVREAFYLATGLAGISLIFGCQLGWKSVKKVKKVDTEKGNETADEEIKA